MRERRVGLRWTIGDVSDAGFEALWLSVWSAWTLFGDEAGYAVCVNSIGKERARDVAGSLPNAVQWIDASRLTPAWLKGYVDPAMGQGVAWKFAPVRVFRDLHEISLDNDVILWRSPTAMGKWLASGDRSACLLSADTQRCLGQFASRCEAGALNSGIRGVPPGFDLEGQLRIVLSENRVTLQSELDEQGLQVMVLAKFRLFIIPTDDVTICSPFPTHQRGLGRCGAHFVGLNVKHAPWIIEGRHAHQVIQERWEAHRGEFIGESLQCRWHANRTNCAAF